MRSFTAHARLTVALFLILAGSAAAQSPPTPAAKALRSLQKTLRREFTPAGNQSSALVLDETTGQTLYSVAANTPRLPASVQKLYTTTTALLTFGAPAELQTSVYGVGSLSHSGVWTGRLYLRGGGDPTFGDAAFDQSAYGTGASVQSLAANLADAGIRRVNGAIIGDESFFDSRRGTVATDFGPDLEYEGELSGLAFDAGFATDSEGSLQGHPARFAAQAFAAALRGAKITLSKKTTVGTGDTPTNATLLADIPSPPMSTLIQLTNTPSDNFFAETLLKDIGARFGGGGTTADGAAVVRATISEHFGVNPVFDDGSGLSDDDRSTASEFVSLLRQLDSNAVFVDSLAVAGVSGTMVTEMLHSRAVGNCRGKTGTLTNVANLVGYCRARNGDLLIFAFLENGLASPVAGHTIEDNMGVALANYNP